MDADIDADHEPKIGYPTNNNNLYEDDELLKTGIQQRKPRLADSDARKIYLRSGNTTNHQGLVRTTVRA
jgi:hypothetical protein